MEPVARVRPALRPVLVALAFLSAAVVGLLGACIAAVQLATLGESPGARTLLASSLLAGAAVGALVTTGLRRPGRWWAGALFAWCVLGLPLTVVTPGASVPVALIAASLGALAVVQLVGAARALEGTSAGALPQVVGVFLVGLAVGLAGPTLGLLGALGAEALVRAGSAVGCGTGLVVLLLAPRALPESDEALGESPLRLLGFGLGLGALVSLGATVLVAALGESPVTRPLGLLALLLSAGAALARVATAEQLEAGLAFRRTVGALGLLLVLALPLTPRLIDLFEFGQAIVRPTPSGWLVELAVRLGLGVVAMVPLTVPAGLALGASARGAGGRGNAGRWLSAVLAGASVGLWLGGWGSPAITGLVAALILVLASSAHRGDRPLIALVLVLGLVGLDWSERLVQRGSALMVGGPVPDAQRRLEAARFAGPDAVTRFVEPGFTVSRAGGQVELVTGLPAEQAVLGVHAAVLTAPGKVQSALVVGVAPGIIEALRAHGIGDLTVVAPGWLLDEAGALGIALDRVVVHRAEPRPFLATSTRQWDLIVMLPARPGAASGRGLFTLEAWRAAKERLTPAGQLVQRLELKDSSSAVLSTALRTLRLLFPHGTTWGGVTELSVVVSELTPTLDPARLDVRLAPVRAALANLGVRSAVGLLAWQVHSSEGQLVAGGSGAVATDRRPSLSASAAAAAFVDEPVVPLDERRLSRPSALAVSLLAQERPLTAAEHRAIVEALSRHLAPWEPLLRAAAEGWLAGDRSPEAAIALATTTLAQGDLADTLAALEPFLKADAPQPEVVRLALEATRKRVERESSVLAPLGVSGLVALGRSTLERHPGNAALRVSLEALERLP